VGGNVIRRRRRNGPTIIIGVSKLYIICVNHTLHIVMLTKNLCTVSTKIEIRLATGGRTLFFKLKRPVGGEKCHQKKKRSNYYYWCFKIVHYLREREPYISYCHVNKITWTTNLITLAKANNICNAFEILSIMDCCR